GRIWRIVWTGQDAKPPKSPGDFTKMRREELDKLLASPNITVRMQATHTLINWSGPDEQEKERAPDRPALYHAHKLWVDEAEPVVAGLPHRLDKKLKENR